MNDFYLNGVGFIDGIFLPLFYFLGLWVPGDPAGAFVGVAIVMSWVGLLHDTTIFPLHFIITFDLLILSFLASMVMRFLRWLVDVIPFA